MKPMIAPHGGSRSRSTVVSLGIPDRLAGATGQMVVENGAGTQIAFAASASVRRLLDAISASGVDLSDASSAEEIAEALTGLCRQGPEREGERQRAAERRFAGAAFRSSTSVSIESA